MPVHPAHKFVIIVAGPTAVGKTAVGIEIARRFRTEIISADSRQCFRELSVGVARPSVKELETVPHHFIASHSIHDEITAAAFEDFALQKTKELFRDHDVVVMVGGTGLYIKAFCEGLDEIPPVPEAIRAAIIQKYEQEGMGWLQNEIERKDPLFFRKGEMQNPHRMMRALEVATSTGQSIFSFRKTGRKKRDFDIIKIGLNLPRLELNERINKRVDQMIKDGLVREAESLLPWKHLNALRTVGYQELFEYFDRKISLEEAITLIKTRTRQYAKRQMTWFTKDEDITWFSPFLVNEINSWLENKMKN